MSAMSLEAEKNELIRRILDVDDVAILRLSLIHISEPTRH